MKPLLLGTKLLKPEMTGLNSNTNYFYRIRVNYNNNLSKNSNIIDASTLVGINKIVQEKFKIYTASESIIIETQELNNTAIVKVYDLTGKIISETNITETRTEISINRKGMFIITIYTEKNIYTKKLKIEN